MELGATVCVPNGAPDCAACPARDFCRGHALGQETLFPVRQAKKDGLVDNFIYGSVSSTYLSAVIDAL